MSRRLPPLALLLCVAATALAQSLRLRVDHPRHDYAVGEEIVFRVESERRGELTYEIKYAERDAPLETGTFDYYGGGAEIRYRPTAAAFLYLRVRLDGETEDLGVAVGLDDIRALAEEPGDFDAFWRQQRALLADVPLDTRLERVDESEYTTDYRFSAASVDGRRVYGFIAVPKGDGPKAAVLQLPPFGESGAVSDPLWHTAERANVIAVNITIHDAPPGERDPEAYEPNDPRDRERIYYRYGVLAAVRAIDVIAELPEWNGRDLFLVGESQGGGLALLTAGIDARVTNVVQAVAALSQHSGVAVGQAVGFPYYLEIADEEFGPEGADRARAAVKYYDALYGARRFTGPSMHFVNYKDPVCPPATNYAAVNEMRGPRVVLHSLDLYHGTPDEFRGDHLFAYLRVHVPSASTPPFPYGSRDLGYRIDAGPDQDLRTGADSDSPDRARLSGDAGRDGATLGRDWTVRWRQLEGPGTTAFDDAGALATAATFSAPGTYRLQLEVTAPHEGDDRKYYELLDELVVTAGEGRTSAAPSLGSVQDVSVYPNPSRGALHVEASFAQADLITVSLRDLTGREVLRGADLVASAGAHARQTLRTGQLPAGAYVLALRGRDGIHRTPVVVSE